jgi:quercetin dioxygenase-like cupin family protein
MRNILEMTNYVSGKMNPETIIKTDKKLVRTMAFDKGFHLKPHKADEDVVILILEGSAEVTLKGSTHKLTTLDYFIFPKDEIHELVALDKMKMLLIK